MNKLLQVYDLVKSMGIKPIAYRVALSLKKKTGLLKKSFPTKTEEKNFVNLNDWRKNAAPFFFQAKEDLEEFNLDDQSKLKLKEEVEKLKEGHFKFFNGDYRFLGKNYDWLTNPESNYKYDISKHWTELETLDPRKGDIKFVWEKSRFSYLNTLIRYDYHHNEDQSKFVFSEIISWINNNPLNMGPNYSCSQEISIRILNWTFALYYYRNSPSLTEEIFQKIINCIYYQMLHVKEHINFSLITVRNNHAITESLLLYVAGTLYPFFPESKIIKSKGKKFLEQEGLYQIYEDGSYLQFSMNYERVVVQLYTWALHLGELNKDSFSDKLHQRLKNVFNFMYQCQDLSTGMLPNYGANDGALFFPLNNCSYRDYRPQLNALHYMLYNTNAYEQGLWNEDIFWFTGKTDKQIKTNNQLSSSFNKGGYYILRDSNKFSFIRCGSYRDRPSQADNLHLDIWYKGKNILRDAGSYKYNTSKEDIKFFMGTSSHNTVMIEDNDQMYKGGRFLWFFWSKALNTSLTEKEEETIFKGSIKGFKHVAPNIIHERTVRQKRNEIKWEIEDTISGTDKTAKQIWNISESFFEDGFEIISKDKNGNILIPILKDGYYSSTYGTKTISKQIIFETDKQYFHTTIIKK